MHGPLDAVALVATYCAEHRCSAAAKELLAQAANSAGMPRVVLWKSRDTPPPEDLHREFCGFIVYAVAHMLEDHQLTDDEHLHISRLKYLFFVEEGNILAYQYDAISDVLQGEISLILQDEAVDVAEDIQQVHLQRAFDLSYDQYLSLSEDVIRPIAERIVAPLRGRVFVPDAEKERAFALLRRLNTVILLDPETFEINWDETACPSGRQSGGSD